MNLKSLIVGHFGGSTATRMTNQQLARELGYPEPSVRRATLQLESKFILSAHQGMGELRGNQIEWSLRQTEDGTQPSV